MAVTCCELKWLRQLLSDFRVSQYFLVPLHCDSQAAIHIIANSIQHVRTKHIENDCHFIRDEYIADRIFLSYVPSQSQLVDIFIKSLGLYLVHDLMCKLGIHNLHTPT